MNKTAIRQALIRGLVGPALLLAVSSALAQVHSVQERREIAQFCAPPDQEGSAPRFYCKDGPASASQQNAQQNAEPRLDTDASYPRTAVVPIFRQ